MSAGLLIRAVNSDDRSHDRFPDRIYDPAGEVSSQALGFSTFWNHYC